MARLDIKNPRFELISSIDKNFNEVQVIFTYKGKEYKYFVFVGKDKKGNPIKEAKRQFNNELKSGKVAKTLHLGNYKATTPLIITVASVFAIAAVTLGALFINQKIKDSDPEYVVSFVSNGGTHVAPIKVKGGKTILPPAAPTKDECAFDGWFDNAELAGEEYTFEDPIKKDITLWAKWGDISDHILLTYNAGEGNTIEGINKTKVEQYVRKGTPFLKAFKYMGLIGGAKEGEDFLYWTVDGNRVTEDYEITEPKELVAFYKPVTGNYLTLTTRTDNAVIEFEYENDYQLSTDGEEWSDETYEPISIRNAGSQIFIRKKPESTITYARKIVIDSNTRYSVSGSPASLFIGPIPDSAFTSCFNSDAYIISAKNIDMSNITLTKSCCSSMFYGCQSLKEAPELPATALTTNCYQSMFSGCSSLTKAPELPAITLAESCYYQMFNGCSLLTEAPELSATELVKNCYKSMFYGCSSLVNAPKLPATTLAEGCYSNMFVDCSSLEVAPKLSVENLEGAPNCYELMFRGCASLTAAPELPATTLSSSCYQNMFAGCSSLTEAPELPATTLANGCYSNMFSGCTSLKVAPKLEVKTLTTGCYSNMFTGCASLTQAPELPATTLATGCYTGMFASCTSLTSAPELPVTTLAPNCYREMFKGCSSLTRTPELPATTLATACYQGMFQGCTSLTDALELKADVLVQACYYGMFQNCTSLTTAPRLPATTLAPSCYYGMFQSCTSLTKVPELPVKSFETSWGSCYYSMFANCSSLRISEDNPGTGTLVCDFSEITTPISGYTNYMFVNTGGSFTTRTPTQGHVYYCY